MTIENDNIEQKLYYHGAVYGMLARLDYAKGLFPDDAPPFCVTQMLGQLCDRIYDAFGCQSYRATVHLPVKKAGKDHAAKFSVDVRVPKMRDACEMDKREPWEIPMEEFTDGTVSLTDYQGPVSWRSESWEGIVIMLVPLDLQPES